MCLPLVIVPTFVLDKTSNYRIAYCKVNNKKRRVNKPWCNNELTTLWNSVCYQERNWVKCKIIAMKNKLKSDYCNIRKCFDREVQRSKRRYWYKLQDDLLGEVNDNPHTFWKSIGKIGINNVKKHIIQWKFSWMTEPCLWM